MLIRLFLRKNESMNIQKATFGLGCFWGAQDVFDRVKGVKKTIVGYMGGRTEDPTYEDICAGSGHTEVVQMEYDEDEVSFEDLLKVFFKNHNSSLKNKEQYKSVVFYHTEYQRKTAEKFKDESSVTEIRPAEKFYKAEEYHQHYFKKNNKKSCHI